MSGRRLPIPLVDLDIYFQWFGTGDFEEFLSLMTEMDGAYLTDVNAKDKAASQPIRKA